MVNMRQDCCCLIASDLVAAIHGMLSYAESKVSKQELLPQVFVKRLHTEAQWCLTLPWAAG